jgi:hypothetical protein
VHGVDRVLLLPFQTQNIFFDLFQIPPARDLIFLSLLGVIDQKKTATSLSLVYDDFFHFGIVFNPLRV